MKQSTVSTRKRKARPPKIYCTMYVPVELKKEMKAAAYGETSEAWTAAGVIALALKDMPEVARAALRVWEVSLPVAVAETRRAIFEQVQKAQMQEYLSKLPATERARILAGAKK